MEKYMKRTRSALFTAPLALALALTPLSADERPAPALAKQTKDLLTPESFARLHKTLCLQPGEYRWDEIPWLASVWHARKKAAAENKPIFVFGTAGAGFNDPLGNC
jgi:hypothetical protein